MVVSHGPARLVEALECLSINIEVPTANILRHSSVVFFFPVSVFQSVGEQYFVKRQLRLSLSEIEETPG